MVLLMLIISLSSWHSAKFFIISSKYNNFALDFSIVIMLKLDGVLWSLDNVSSMYLSFSYS